MSEQGHDICFIKTGEFSGLISKTQGDSESSDSAFWGLKGMIAFPNACYPLFVCEGSRFDCDVSSVLFSIGMNIRCREQYRSDLLMLLLMINLTSLENLWFRVDRHGELYVSTEIEILNRYPTDRETELIIKNLFAAASDYLADIETVVAEAYDSAERKKVLDWNFSYYWRYKTEVPSFMEKEPLTGTAFRCFTGYPFSDWINSGFDSLM